MTAATEDDFLAWLKRIREPMHARLPAICADPELQALYTAGTTMADTKFAFRLTVDGIRWDVSDDWWSRYPVTQSAWDHTPHRLIRWADLAERLGLTVELSAPVQDALF